MSFLLAEPTFNIILVHVSWDCLIIRPNISLDKQFSWHFPYISSPMLRMSIGDWIVITSVSERQINDLVGMFSGNTFRIILFNTSRLVKGHRRLNMSLPSWFLLSSGSRPFPALIASELFAVIFRLVSCKCMYMELHHRYTNTSTRNKMIRITFIILFQ